MNDVGDELVNNTWGKPRRRPDCPFVQSDYPIGYSLFRK